MITSSKDVESASSVASDSYRALVNRVVESATFARSKRLSGLLEFICDLALSGKAAEISEQKIGEDVFGRSRFYDASNDGIVRTQASRLRQRLDRYFDEEGIDEPVRIVIPRGGYVPLFEPRPSSKENPSILETIPSDPQAELTVESPASQGKSRRPPYFAWSLVTILAIAISVIVLHDRRVLNKPSVPQLPSNSLWSNMFLRGRRTLVVPGDNGLVVWQGLMKRNLSLAEFMKGEYRTEAPTPANLSTKIATDLSNRRYTSIVDLEVVQSLIHLSEREMSAIEMRYARDVRPNDLRESNVILIGAPEANPWVELFEPNMNFVFFVDRPHDIFAIVNRNPHGGEPKQWTRDPANVFAVVAYLPGLSGERNTLILGGTSMAGTECALNFVTDDAQLSPFLKLVRRPDGTLRHFEAVVGTTFVSGSALKGNVLAWRTTD
jgi:hypothetical protein